MLVHTYTHIKFMHFSQVDYLMKFKKKMQLVTVYYCISTDTLFRITRVYT